MDTSGDKPPQYDNSLIVLSFTQKTTKPSQKASYKASPKAHTHKVPKNKWILRQRLSMTNKGRFRPLFSRQPAKKPSASPASKKPSREPKDKLQSKSKSPRTKKAQKDLNSRLLPWIRGYFAALSMTRKDKFSMTKKKIVLYETKDKSVWQ